MSNSCNKAKFLLIKFDYCNFFFLKTTLKKNSLNFYEDVFSCAIAMSKNTFVCRLPLHTKIFGRLSQFPIEMSSKECDTVRKGSFLRELLPRV